MGESQDGVVVDPHPQRMGSCRVPDCRFGARVVRSAEHGAARSSLGGSAEMGPAAERRYGIPVHIFFDTAAMPTSTVLVKFRAGECDGGRDKME